MKTIAVVALIVLESIVAIAGFTFLAYHFNHWWIALFAIFFCTWHVNTDDMKGEDDETERGRSI